MAQVIDRSLVSVHRFARAQLSSADAEDAVAEVFAVAFRRLPDVPEDPDQAHAWVMGVARRVVWSQIRSLRRRRALLAKLEARHRPSATGGSVEGHVELSVLRQAIGRLGRRDREVIALLATDELDRYAMARLLGCTPATAAVRIHRARQRLRIALAEQDQPHHQPLPPKAAVR